MRRRRSIDPPACDSESREANHVSTSTSPVAVPSLVERAACNVNLPAPSGLALHEVKIGSDEYVLLSFPIPTWHLPEGLSEAEQAVVIAVLKGASNEDVARVRGTSPRTVANQLRSIFTKLKVSSRVELALVLSVQPSHTQETKVSPSRQRGERGRAKGRTRRAPRSVCNGGK